MATSAAITENAFGSGTALYVGSMVDGTTMDAIVDRACRTADVISPVANMQEDLEVVEKQKDGKT